MCKWRTDSYPRDGTEKSANNCCLQALSQGLNAPRNVLQQARHGLRRKVTELDTYQTNNISEHLTWAPVMLRPAGTAAAIRPPWRPIAAFQHVLRYCRVVLLQRYPEQSVLSFVTTTIARYSLT